MTSPLPLQPQVFLILRGLIEDWSGLRYDLDDLEMLAERISPRARELGFDSALDYYYFLRYDDKGPAELEKLLEALLVHETYFFRQAAQLEQLVDSCLAPRVAEGAHPRVWCAGVASGEEAYTLAMMLGERKLLGNVEVVATDLSRPALAHAERGVYSGRALRAIVGTVASRWLEPKGEHFEVVPALRGAITWKRVNLLDPAQVVALGTFDAILCRNVLIYFADQTTTRVVQQLTASLKDQGVLLVGASESLMRFGTSLKWEERSGSFFYRKAA